nr:reverse transcriptase domain-containing protein [Tanacetum cinerariifolium]
MIEHIGMLGRGVGYCSGGKKQSDSYASKRTTKANILREVKYQTWVSNPVIVKKADGRWKLCIDFTDINKACPKEIIRYLQLSRKHKTYNDTNLNVFLDACKGYQQILIVEKDEEKTAFYTREGVSYYKRLTFGLKNAGETYQRLIDKVFSCQVGRNMEVNAGEMVIKSDSEEEILVDIKKTLKRLRVISLKLNPKKCSFRVEEGMFSGHLITKQRIKADPSKVKAISYLKPLKSKDKEIKNREAKRKNPESKNAWKLFTDEASSSDGSGAGLIFSTSRKSSQRALRSKETSHKAILGKGKHLLVSFPTYLIEHVKMDQNKKADALSKLASMTFSKLAKEFLVEVLQENSITQKEVTNVTQKEEDNWMIHIREFLQLGKLLDDPQKARKLRVNAPYKIMDGTFYRRSYFSSWLRTTTNSPRRRKVPSSGHRLLHKMGRSEATNINDREAHGKVEVTNREVVKGMEHRLRKTHQGWVDELPQVLWAHRTTLKSSNGETPFSLVYGLEAVILIEISVETRRI